MTHKTDESRDDVVKTLLRIGDLSTWTNPEPGTDPEHPPHDPGFTRAQLEISLSLQ